MAMRRIPQDQRGHKGAKIDLGAAVVRSLLDYDPLTGEFRWKKPNRWHRPGVIGCIRPNGGGGLYVSISIMKSGYFAHRLAWVIMTGEWPTHEIDHKDTDGTNNKWDNLREATSLQNLLNRHVRRDSITGFKGVSPTKNGKYTAMVKFQGKKYHLGTFATAEEASVSYRDAAIRLCGEFARWE